MKRLFALVLALLILAGCGSQNMESPETKLPDETQSDPGWYIQNSEMERVSGGAIRTYGLPIDDVQWIETVGANLLLATTTGFAVLSGDTGVVAASLTPEIAVTADSGVVQYTAQGLAYYLAQSNEVVYLDQSLQVISRITLPETPDGMPAVSSDGNEIFYCQGNEIRAYDTNRNITRPVKSQIVKEISQLKTLFGGSVLSCNVLYESGEESVVYLDSKTGETLSTDKQVAVMDTSANAYFAVSNDGLLRQEIFGTLNGEPFALDLSDDTVLIPAVDMNGVVGVTIEQDKPVKMSFYDFSTGKITGEVSLPGVEKILSSVADKWSRCIWLLAESAGDVCLYRWNPAKSKVNLEESFITPVYTPGTPDEAGIGTCKTKANALNKTYEVDIRIWKDAVAETGDYTVIPEHRPAAIDRVLDELEYILQIFPDKFLRKSTSRPLRICIVRSIEGEAQSAQFFKNSNAYIFITSGSNVKDAFICGLGYVINSRVVSNTSLLDSWTKLNPEGFVYGQGNEKYLSVDDRAFADEKSMTSVVEDRSGIFRYAMGENNEDVFASETMQEKLRLLCEGIRKVWKWKKEEASFPWEQYLKEPLAYKK